MEFPAVNYVYDIRTKSERLGRFGWKANQSDLYNQTAQAYLEDMGVTSLFLPKIHPMDSCNTIIRMMIRKFRNYPF
jgi:CxxC motif-containing protein (DUF1111 family)